MADDFIGSVAQEDVQFTTELIYTTNPGDNYWRLMVFIEDSRYITRTSSFTEVPGLDPTITIATVTKDTYATLTQGLLLSWLNDYYFSGHPNEVMLVRLGTEVTTDTATFISQMTTAYQKLKARAYWKVALCELDSNPGIADPSVEGALIDLCAQDKDLLSGPVPLPYETDDPLTPANDPMWATAQGKYAWLTAYQIPGHNMTLMRIGRALLSLNGSGTCVGNDIDFISIAGPGLSGPGGSELDQLTRQFLEDNKIGYFKAVGDSTGNVVAVGVYTLENGAVLVGTEWVRCYITYMTKVQVAQYITRPNILKSAGTYSVILGIMSSNLSLFRFFCYFSMSSP